MKSLKNFFQHHVIALLVLSLSFSFIQSAPAKDVKFPSFDKSLSRHGRSQIAYDKYYAGETTDPLLLQLRKNSSDFRNIYKKNILLYVKDKKAPVRIPKVVHQIWLGGNVPEKFQEWMSTWMNINGWKYRLWTDKDVKKFNLHNQALFDKAKDYGEKADIFRYEILYRFGGVYADVDFECVNSKLLEQFNKSFDFYVGFEPIEHKQMKISHLIGNAIIGSVPGHPILEKVILNMADHYKENSDLWAVVATGPVYLTETILEYNKDPDPKYIDIFLPPTFFFPFKFADGKKENREQSFKNLIKPETAAVHYFSGSWLDKNKPPKKVRTKEN